jgi:hypothetical protein
LPIALSGKSLGDQSFKVHPKGFQGLVAAAGRRGFAEQILVEPECTQHVRRPCKNLAFKAAVSFDVITFSFSGFGFQFHPRDRIPRFRWAWALSPS